MSNKDPDGATITMRKTAKEILAGRAANLSRQRGVRVPLTTYIIEASECFEAKLKGK